VGVLQHSVAGPAWPLLPSHAVGCHFIVCELMNPFENLIKGLGSQFLQISYTLTHNCYNLALFLTFKARLWILDGLELYDDDSRALSQSVSHSTSVDLTA